MMSYARDRSILQLHLPEGWPAPDAPDHVFRYARYSGNSCETGVAELSAMPAATTTIAVAPASAVHFVRVSLPGVRAARLAKLLPLAVEEAVATTPEEIHVVLVEQVPGGASLVAVVNKDWLAAALEALAHHGFRPRRVIVETELAAKLAALEATHPWVVVRSPSGGFACLGAGEIIALDLGADTTALPLALRLARSTHRRRGETPDEILVFSAPGISPPDLEAWGRALEIPVRSGGDWRPEVLDGRALRVTDLLRGGIAAKSDAICVSRSVKLAGVTAAAVLAAHMLLTFGDWWRLSGEARSIRSQMETRFREIFPDARVVVDAPLQMQRGLGRLRREAGVPDASDFVPLLAAVGPVVSAAGLHAERMRYEGGALELEVTLPLGEGREALEKRLVIPGYRVRVERTSPGPSGDIAMLIVSAEG
jgi:general secretion pathway protein L